ncbi:MAG TPA: DoxX family protein, partial [Devosia sp.]|nr:DoxX family protein [Devosia sp.]
MGYLHLLLRDRALTNSPILGWTALPLRLAIGYGFLAHGWAKLSRGPDSFGQVLATLGVPLPDLAAWLTTIVELAG